MFIYVVLYDIMWLWHRCKTTNKATAPRVEQQKEGYRMSKRELLDTIEMLRGKIDAGKLITFVGAGVSKNVTGMPDWYQLVKAMADKIGYSRCTSCRNKTDNCTHVFTRKEYQTVHEQTRI